MDDDGYPTEDDLEQVRAFTGSPHELIDLVTSMWNFPPFVKVTDFVDRYGVARKRVEMVTGGWSGNEDLASALAGTVFHLTSWESTHRGGLTVYEVRTDTWDVPMEVTLTRPDELGGPALWVVLRDHPAVAEPVICDRRFPDREAAAAEVAFLTGVQTANGDKTGYTYRVAAVCPAV